MDILYPGIARVRGAYERPRELIDFAERAGVWGPVGYDGTEGRRTAEGCPVSVLAQRSAAFALLDVALSKTMGWGVRRYAEQYRLQIQRDEGYELVRYLEGGGFTSHLDANPSRGWVRSVSAVLYLNDDFEGGELCFEQLGLSVRPEEGALVLFPSGVPFRHSAKAVRNGTKYIVPTWFA